MLVRQAYYAGHGCAHTYMNWSPNPPVAEAPHAYRFCPLFDGGVSSVYESGRVMRGMMLHIHRLARNPGTIPGGSVLLLLAED